MALDYRYFSKHTREILQRTQEIAQTLGQQEIRLEHLFLAMTRAEDTDAFFVLDDYDIIESKLMPFVKRKQAPNPENTGSEIQISEDVKSVLERAVEAAQSHTTFVSSAHLLIGLMQYESIVITDILAHFDLNREMVISQAQEYLGIIKSVEKPEMEQFPTPEDDNKPKHLFGQILKFFGVNRIKRKRHE